MSITTKLIEYDHDGQLLEGFAAYDESIKGERPVVLVSHAWAGRGELECSKAIKLAELGYVGFALDLYGKGILGQNPEENRALMEPLREDREKLQSRLLKANTTAAAMEQSDANRIAAIGFCFGGLCVLDMARANHPVLGVVSFHGLFSPAPNSENKQISAKILALHGWDDPMVPPEQVIALTKELSDANADWQLHAYGSTLHAFTNPAANNPDFGTVYDETADRRSWVSACQFLEELFP